MSDLHIIDTPGYILNVWSNSLKIEIIKSLIPCGCTYVLNFKVKLIRQQVNLDTKISTEHFCETFHSQNLPAFHTP